MEKEYYVYILFNKKNGALYTGITSDLIKRVWEHKNNVVESFSSKYNIDKLGYYEIYKDSLSAINREKQIKAGNRKRKIELIEKDNPNWIDLYESLI